MFTLVMLVVQVQKYVSGLEQLAMKNILIFIGFMLLVLAGIAGIFQWQVAPRSVGYYQISKNLYGVAIYQDGLHESVQFAAAQKFIISGNTISIYGSTSVFYGRDDIVFDQTSIYTDPTQEQIDFLHKNKMDTSVLSNIVYLENPHIPGVLELQGKNLRIDKNQKQITGEVQTVIVHDSI